MPTSKTPRSRRPAVKAATSKRTSRARPTVASPSRKASAATRKPLPSRTAPVKTADTKQARLIALLRGTAGATVTQMTDLTGWQPHSVRGVISGVLRKKLGLTVACTSDGTGARVYRIVES